SYTNGITRMDTDYLVLSTDGNDNVMMSRLQPDDFDDVEVDGLKEKLGLFPAVVMNYDDPNMIDTREEVYVFGVENIKFFLPGYSGVDSLSGDEIILD